MLHRWGGKTRGCVGKFCHPGVRGWVGNADPVRGTRVARERRVLFSDEFAPDSANDDVAPRPGNEP